MGTKFSLMITLTALVSAISAIAEAGTPARSPSSEPARSLSSEPATSEEHKDRIVDQAAVDTQNDAERELVELTSKYRGTAREAGLLLRLAELRLEIADTLFRVVYAPGQENLQKSHRATLTRAVAPLTRILSAYPRTAEFPRALFLRGKAYRELGALTPAARDLEAFIARYPKREEAALAAIGIADLSIQQKNFKRAITVLKGIASQPSHPYYPHALQKRAWSFHVEGNNLRAVQELRRIAQFFKTASADRTKGLSAIRGAVIDDASSIAYSAFRDNRSKFPLTQANELLREFDTGPQYREMAANMADRLRAADLSKDLHDWKHIVLKSDPSRKDNLRILVSILEYELDREAYADAVEVAGEVADVISKNPQAEYAEESKALVLKASERLTKRITDYKKSVKSTAAERTLNALLPSIDKLLGENDPRRFVIRWNLAETLFSLGRFESAAHAYRWVYQQGERSNLHLEAGLKAVSSRYETLRDLKVIPKDLEVRPSVRPNLPAKKLALLREWTQWIDDLSSKKLNAQHTENLNRFHFEANRSLYQAGFQDESLGRLRAHALSATSSSVSIASAALVIDTWIARKNWERVEAHALEFTSASGWKDAKFPSRMATQAAQARFKRAEEAVAAKDHRSALTHAYHFMKQYPKNSQSLDARGIACNAHRALGEFDATLECLEVLVREYPRTAAAREALRTAAQIQDDRFQFLSAADYYQRFVAASGRELKTQEVTALKMRVLKLIRASGDASKIEQLSSSRKLCNSKELRADCELNLAIASLLENSSSESAVNVAVRNSARAPKNLRAIWATQAIVRQDQLSTKTLDRVLGNLAESWGDSEISVRYLLIPRLTKVIPAALTQEREGLRKFKVDAQETTLLRRLQALREFEKRAEIAGKLPLNSVKLAAFEQTYAAYTDLIEALQDLPAPKKASAAQKAEHQKILRQITQPFVLKSRQLKDQMSSLSYRQRSGMDIDSFEDIWEKQHSFRTPVAETLRSAWPKAIRSGDWSQVAFFADESSQMKNLPKDWVKAARALSLARSGAEAEARIIFADTCRGSSDLSSLKGMCRAAVQNRKGRG